MSLREKKTKGIPYWLFTAGRERTIHLGPVNEPSKIRQDKVVEALDYVVQRAGHYTKVENHLVELLHEPYKEKYLVDRLKDLTKYEVSLMTSLSEDGKREYLRSRIADLQTRLRQVKEELPKDILSNYIILENRPRVRKIIDDIKGLNMESPKDRKVLEKKLNKLKEMFKQ